MRTLLSILGLMSLSTTVLSLGETNCSDAKGELMRVEKEIWGANDVGWYYKGTKLAPGDTTEVEGLPETIVQIYGDKNNGQYLMDVVVRFADGTESITKKVLCEAWKNGAID